MPKKTAYLIFFALLLGGLSFASTTAEEYPSVSIIRGRYDGSQLQPRLAIDTTFHYSNRLQLSTTTVVLVGDPSDLVDGDVICPGVVTASPTASVDWIYDPNLFSASCAFPLLEYNNHGLPPPQGYTSPHGIVWNQSFFSTLRNTHDGTGGFDKKTKIPTDDPLYGQIPAGYRERVTYYPKPSGEDSGPGDSGMTFIGDGDITITASDGGPITRTTQMDNQQPQTFTLSSLGDWTFDSTIGVDAIGMTHQLVNPSGGDPAHQNKYLYGNTADLPHTTSPASIWITVDDPDALYITLVGTDPSGTVPMSAGQTIPFTIRVTNEDASIVSVNATGASVTPSAFTFTPTGGFNVPIPADSSYVHTLTGDLTAPDPLPPTPVEVCITIHFQSRKVCDGNPLYENLTFCFNVTQEAGPVRCTLAPPMVAMRVGYTQLFTATCYNSTDDNVSCGHLDWTSTAGTMNPPSTDTPPNTSESTLTAENIGNLQDVTATHANFSCSALVNVVNGDRPVSCILEPDPEYFSYYQKKQFNATCYNITGDTVPCQSLNWSTTCYLGTVDPVFTMEPPNESKSNLTVDGITEVCLMKTRSSLVGGNNFTCNATVYVSPTGPNLKPELGVEPYVYVGNSTTIWINTTNDGTDPTGNESSTTLTIDGVEVHSYLVPDLLPSDTVPGSYLYTCPSTGPSNHTIIGAVDVNDTVDERMYENDNNVTRYLRCIEKGEPECEDYV